MGSRNLCTHGSGWGRTDDTTNNILASIFGDEGVFDHHTPPRHDGEWNLHRSRKPNTRYRVVDDLPAEQQETDLLLRGSSEHFHNVGYNSLRPPPDALQGLSTTFMHMEYRKLKRSSSSSYHDHP